MRFGRVAGASLEAEEAVVGLRARWTVGRLRQQNTTLSSSVFRFVAADAAQFQFARVGKPVMVPTYHCGQSGTF